MHGRAPNEKTLPGMQEESNEVLSIATFLSENISDSPEMYHKVMRVKSLKMYHWLMAESAVFDLFCCCVVIRSLERVMWSFMKWQDTDTWLIQGQSPLIQMSNMNTSPAAKAIREMAGVMLTSSFGADPIPIDDFAAGVFLCLILNWTMWNGGVWFRV